MDVLQKVICTCEDFKKYMPEITSAQTVAWLHDQKYSGPMFKFCPWCGEELISVKLFKKEEKNE